jgi:methylated-DNA-protein-cysteine methyltransferase-like protein
MSAEPPVDDFVDAVSTVIAAIPEGEVMTYGEVAAEAGYPGAARAVGNVLGGSDGELPWWRVVTAAGRLVPGHEAEHARRLRSEGVSLRTGPTRVAMERR